MCKLYSFHHPSRIKPIYISLIFFIRILCFIFYFESCTSASSVRSCTAHAHVFTHHTRARATFFFLLLLSTRIELLGQRYYYSKKVTGKGLEEKKFKQIGIKFTLSRYYFSICWALLCVQFYVNKYFFYRCVYNAIFLICWK